MDFRKAFYMTFGLQGSFTRPLAKNFNYVINLIIYGVPGKIVLRLPPD